MSAAIIYEPERGVILSTPRPDSFWCELVRVFIPEKSYETGDGDPYGAGGIEIGPDDVAALERMAERWPEVGPLIEEAKHGKTWVRRQP